MSSWDVERQHKLHSDFDNVFREHDRLYQDLRFDNNEEYQSLLNSIDTWEQDAIRKVRKTANTARKDLQQIFKNAQNRLQLTLHDAVTEGLHEALKQKTNLTEFHIDKWLANLSEIRREFDAISSTINFSHDKNLHLIKLKQELPTKRFSHTILNYEEFNFESVRGSPIFHKAEYLISTTHSATILSQDAFSEGTHYFRFRIERTTDELFFGIINVKDCGQLKQNIHPIPSIYGWWNIDRPVINGRKEPYVSALRIYNGDEVIFILNCPAREIFLHYPSMRKLNSLKLINNGSKRLPPWKLLIEVGKPGQCMLRLLDWGRLGHETSY